MYHYNAFISYNHNPRDKKIAHILQHKLENYRLPADLSKAYGRDGIKRVFLDTGELEVSGDLNAVITDALSNSDYLIVICSPESKSSIWVHREIEFFLQTHSRDHILTVITAGEPFDVLPELLLHEDTVDEATGEISHVSLEPLSCDYRLPLRKAHKQELPRLVAALIGCRYDDLVQRQRVYALRRRTAILSAAAVILSASIGYLVWSNHRIQVNYENSLREQSLSLAMESEKALARGDRLGAVRYALDALPSDKKDRPVVSRAVLALTDALDLYRTSSGEHWTPAAQYRFERDCAAIVPFSTDSGRYLAAVSTGGRMYLWDTDEKAGVMDDYLGKLHDSGTDVCYCLASDNNDLVLICKDSLIALDMSSRKEKYRVPLVLSSGAAAEVLPETDPGRSVCLAGDRLWIKTGRHEEYALLGIDLSTGSIIKEYKLDERPERIRISDDGRTLALLYKDIDASDSDTVSLIDAGDGSAISSFSGICICDADFTGDNTLVTCGYTEQQDLADPSAEPDYNLISMEESRYYTSSVNRTEEICCYDIRSGSLLWKNEKKDLFSGMPWLEIRKDPGTSDADILCITGSSVTEYTGSGSVEADLDFRSPVINFFREDDSVRAILRDGSLAYYDKEEERFTSDHNIFPSYVAGAAAEYGRSGQRIFIAASSSLSEVADNFIIQYEFAGSDPELTDFEYAEAEEGISIRRIATDPYRDSCIEVTGSHTAAPAGQKTEIHLVRRSMTDGKVIFDKVITSGMTGDLPDYRYSGLDEEKGLAYFACIHGSYEPGLITVNLETGETSQRSITIHDDISDEMKYHSRQVDLLPDTDDYTAGLRSIRAGTIYYPALIYDVTGTVPEEKRLVLLTVDPETGEAGIRDICPVDGSYRFGEDYMMAVNAECERLLMVSSSGNAACYDFSGEKIFSEDEPDFVPAAVGICDDGTLLAAEKNESSYMTVHRYDPVSGTGLSDTELGYISSSGRIMKEVSLSDGNALLSLGRNYAFVLSSEDQTLLSRIPGSYLCYNSQVDEFVIGSEYKNEYGHVPYRTLDEIIAEGNELLSN